jgi:hypothetical protein
MEGVGLETGGRGNGSLERGKLSEPENERKGKNRSRS